MDIDQLIQLIEASALAEWLRTSLKALPIVNAIHVIGIALVFGTILIVDLRLVGVASTQRSVKSVTEELVPYTWIGFALALLTGAALFTVNAGTYMQNTAFFVKMSLIGLAGVNMLIFNHIISRDMMAWNEGPPAPRARISGALAFTFWALVIIFGRTIGFTKGYDFEVPDDMDFEFGFLMFETTVSNTA